jgi:hypothetical protein
MVDPFLQGFLALGARREVHSSGSPLLNLFLGRHLEESTQLFIQLFVDALLSEQRSESF